MSAPVFKAFTASGSAPLTPDALRRSRNWPATRPRVPTAPDRIFVNSLRVTASVPRKVETVENAPDSSAIAASMAASSPKARCVVGWPRRICASSMQGRSSRISDAVCTISAAQPASIAGASGPPRSSQTSAVSKGRKRLPPAVSDDDIASLRPAS
ncbi:hypothetical protein LUX29_07850 [Aureimonas altamirensis]|nr:hypothetical protein [Aureimonas altamirensis]UHD47087.1 hypothetical protein LUX29_07850 [Aureimonas altamirensis]